MNYYMKRGGTIMEEKIKEIFDTKKFTKTFIKNFLLIIFLWEFLLTFFLKFHKNFFLIF